MTGVRELPTGTVTLVFTDIQGSTDLLHAHPATYGDILAEHHRLLRSVWADHDGVVVDIEGDAFFVAFARVTDAVAAVTEAQQALGVHVFPGGVGVRVRMAVHTGEPHVRDGAYWGVDVHYAARLGAAAHGGQVLLSAATRALLPDVVVDDLGEHAVKDFPVARPLFHLVVGGVRAAAFPAPRTLRVSRNNLPSATAPLIGRAADRADVVLRLRAGERLVTLTGLGGTGKTRLALAAAGDLVDDVPGGVWVVPAAALPDGDALLYAIADAVGAAVGQGDAVVDAVTRKLGTDPVLLVLDNLEHLLADVTVVGVLLERCPGLQVLATSQAPLRVQAEQVVPLDTLTLPALDETDPAEALRSGAVAMFVDRARAADPSFAVTAANVADVVALCRRLDGFPLALELAAARVRMGGARGLLGAVERGIDALGRGRRDLPERQRGLRAALDTTVALLDANARAVFEAVAAFADTWSVDDLDDLVALWGGDLDTWEGSAVLLDLSLVRAGGDGRFTMAERVRTHVRELVDAGSDRDVLYRAHLELMVTRAARLYPVRWTEYVAVQVAAREAWPDVEVALARFGDDLELAGRLAVRWLPLFPGGHGAALVPVVERFDAGSTPEDDGWVGYLECALEMVAILRNDMAGAGQRALAVVEAHRRAGDARDLASDLVSAAHHQTYLGDASLSRELVREGLALRPDPLTRETLEGVLAFAAVADEDWDDAEQRLTEIVAQSHRTDWIAVTAPSWLGDVHLVRGGHAEAYRCAMAMVLGFVDPDAGSSHDGDHFLLGAAALAEAGRPGDAARLVGVVEELWRTTAAPVEDGWWVGRVPYGAEIDAAHAASDPASWRAAVAAGAAMTLRQAIAWMTALADTFGDEPGQTTMTGSPGAGSGGSVNEVPRR
ncbi:ATP-binding protein [Jatrophihabitans sp. YIM 134969]